MSKIVPGEWQEERNEWGGVRRFRMVGNCKEYETMIQVDGIQIPQSQLEDYNRRKREAANAQRAQANASPAPRRCPFNGGMATNCKQESCALFNGETCALSRIAATAAAATVGKSCPFNPYNCTPKCALYNSGCIITAIK